MTKQTNEVGSDSKDKNQIVGILNKLIWASWFAFLFELITGLYYNDRNLIFVMLIGSALLFVPFFLVKRGHIQLGSLITILLVIGTVTYIAVIGEGIRDIAIMSFPIIIIFAGLILNRRVFGVIVSVTIVAAIGLVFGEAKGWFIAKPFNGTNSNLFYFLGITIILLISTLAADLFAKNVRNTINLSEQEVGKRKRV